MRRFLKDTYDTFLMETRIIWGDFGMLLVASLAILIYGFIYSYAYSPEVLHRVPTVVVDRDKSPFSEEFARALSLSPNIEVVSEAEDMSTAERLLLEREAYAILYIEPDFSERILSNQTAYFSSYSDASYFLAYKQFLLATNEVMLDFNRSIKERRYRMAGASSHDAAFLSQPIDYTTQYLYNTSQGYASFLMPAILMLIIQQTILLVCGMLFGKARELGGMRTLLYTSQGRARGAGAIVVGRSIYYLLSNLVTWGVVMVTIFPIFGFIDNGNIFEITLFLLPYLVSSIFLGIFLSTFMRQRESSLVYLFFTSIPFLFLSGVSWPMEGMPTPLVWLSRLTPSTSAIEGYVQLETMGASLQDVVRPFFTMLILAIIFFVAAYLRYARLVERFKGE